MKEFASKARTTAGVALNQFEAIQQLDRLCPIAHCGKHFRKGLMEALAFAKLKHAYRVTLAKLQQRPLETSRINLL